VDCLTGAVQVTLGVVYVTLYAPHTRTDRILGRGPCLLLFTIKASPGPTNACVLAPKLSVDCLTGAVQVTLGVVYVTLYFRLPITQRFPVRPVVKWWWFIDVRIVPAMQLARCTTVCEE
jgi:hypothetical protein